MMMMMMDIETRTIETFMLPPPRMLNSNVHVLHVAKGEGGKTKRNRDDERSERRKNTSLDMQHNGSTAGGNRSTTSFSSEERRSEKRGVGEEHQPEMGEQHQQTSAVAATSSSSNQTPQSESGRAASVVVVPPPSTSSTSNGTVVAHAAVPSIDYSYNGISRPTTPSRSSNVSANGVAIKGVGALPQPQPQQQQQRAAAAAAAAPVVTMRREESERTAAMTSNADAGHRRPGQPPSLFYQPHDQSTPPTHHQRPTPPLTGSDDREPIRPSSAITVTSSSHLQPPNVGGIAVADFSQPGSLSIGFENVTVVVDKNTALERLSGVVRSGHLTGLVSCCGNRGDYVLLSVLAGYEEPGSGGTVLANGTPVFAPAFRHSSVLLDEDFTSMDELTVRQQLQFAASMRCSSLECETVDDMISLMVLEGVQQKPVGSCSLYIRRRVALGKELLLRPKAVFVDQPTQGLATHEARQFLQILRRVAQKGAVVVVTLVQPRWVLLELMDDVILLEGKLVAYRGTSRDLLQRLQVDSEHIPDSALTSMYRLASSPECSLVDTFRRSAGGVSDRTGQILVEHFFGLCAAGSLVFNPSPPARVRPLSQLLCLVQYSLHQVRNNVVLYSTFFAVVLLSSIVLAAIYSSQTGQSGMQNRIGIIFFLVSSTFLHNMLFVEARRREYLSFLRHRMHGYYGAATYLTFTVISSAFVRFCSSAIFTIVVYSLGNIGSEWDYSNLRDLVAVVALTSYSTNLVVYFVSCVSRTVRLAHFILFAFYTFNVILAGIILNVNTLPKPFQVISLASHIRLGYESAVITQFVGQDFGCASVNQAVSCYTGDQYLTFLGFNSDRKWLNVELLCVWCGVTILAWYAVLVFYRPPRKMV